MDPLQFWPRNPYTTNALRYTGRFQVKNAVQARQICKYVAVILQYVKRFVVSEDDKAIVPIEQVSVVTTVLWFVLGLGLY